MSDPNKIYVRPPVEREPVNPFRLALVILALAGLVVGVFAIFGGGTALGISALSFGVLCFVGWLIVAAVTWRR